MNKTKQTTLFQKWGNPSNPRPSGSNPQTSNGRGRPKSKATGKQNTRKATETWTRPTGPSLFSMVDSSKVAASGAADEEWGDVDDGDLIEVAEVGLSDVDNTSVLPSELETTQIEDLPGFDAAAGRIWIYPTNYPIREYQYAIVQKALFKNTLVVLPTGLGKTFIAAVVMYNFYRWYPQGKVVFMAPTKPLVAQQIEACYNIMGIPQKDAAEMTGAMQPAERQKAWGKRWVFFLTPQVMINDMSRGACPATDIKCVVIDEAHKALGNHAYCQVVRELAKQNSQFRVLALSATPGTNIKAVQQVLSNMLISHIELRTEESPDIRPYSHERRVDKIVVPMGEELSGVQEKYLQIMNGVISRLKRHRVIYNREAKSLSKFLILKAREAFRQDPPADLPPQQYGVVEGDFALAMSLYHGYELIQQHGMRSLYNYLKGLQSGDKGYGRTRMELQRNVAFCDLMSSLREKFEPQNNNKLGTQGSPLRASQGNSPCVTGHPKMDKLQEVVLEHLKKFTDADGNCNTRIMIFSQYRDSVSEITQMLKRHRPIIKVMCFIGQSSAGKSTKGFTQKEQLEVMRQFREGGYNTLVSTSVGEEGLDIGDVDLIICFDANWSPIRLVQRMGRTGRKREGRIVMLLTQGKEEQIYNQSQYSKRSIHRAIQNGAKSLVFYANSPRMVPQHFTPSCHKMYITVTEKFRGHKGLNTKAGISKQKAWRKEEIKHDKKPPVEDGMLSVEEVQYWNDHFKVPEKDVKKLAPSQILSLDGNKPRRLSGLTLSLSDWTAWQNRLQPSFRIGHSVQSKQLVELMEFMELQAAVDDDGESYHREMQTYLVDSDVIKPEKQNKGIAKYCVPSEPGSAAERKSEKGDMQRKNRKRVRRSEELMNLNVQLISDASSEDDLPEFNVGTTRKELGTEKTGDLISDVKPNDLALISSCPSSPLEKPLVDVEDKQNGRKDPSNLKNCTIDVDMCNEHDEKLGPGAIGEDTFTKLKIKDSVKQKLKDNFVNSVRKSTTLLETSLNLDDSFTEDAADFEPVNTSTNVVAARKGSSEDYGKISNVELKHLPALQEEVWSDDVISVSSHQEFSDENDYRTLDEMEMPARIKNVTSSETAMEDSESKRKLAELFPVFTPVGCFTFIGDTCHETEKQRRPPPLLAGQVEATLKYLKERKQLSPISDTELDSLVNEWQGKENTSVLNPPLGPLILGTSSESELEKCAISELETLGKSELEEYCESELDKLDISISGGLNENLNIEEGIISDQELEQIEASPKIVSNSLFVLNNSSSATDNVNMKSDGSMSVNSDESTTITPSKIRNEASPTDGSSTVPFSSPVFKSQVCVVKPFASYAKISNVGHRNVSEKSEKPIVPEVVLTNAVSPAGQKYVPQNVYHRKVNIKEDSFFDHSKDDSLLCALSPGRKISLTPQSKSVTDHKLDDDHSQITFSEAFALTHDSLSFSPCVKQHPSGETNPCHRDITGQERTYSEPFDVNVQDVVDAEKEHYSAERKETVKPQAIVEPVEKTEECHVEPVEKTEECHVEPVEKTEESHVPTTSLLDDRSTKTSRQYDKATDKEAPVFDLCFDFDDFDDDMEIPPSPQQQSTSFFRLSGASTKGPTVSKSDKQEETRVLATISEVDDFSLLSPGSSDRDSPSLLHKHEPAINEKGPTEETVIEQSKKQLQHGQDNTESTKSNKIILDCDISLLPEYDVEDDLLLRAGDSVVDFQKKAVGSLNKIKQATSTPVSVKIHDNLYRDTDSKQNFMPTACHHSEEHLDDSIIKVHPHHRQRDVLSPPVAMCSPVSHSAHQEDSYFKTPLKAPARTKPKKRPKVLISSDEDTPEKPQNKTSRLSMLSIEDDDFTSPPDIRIQKHSKNKVLDIERKRNKPQGDKKKKKRTGGCAFIEEEAVLTDEDSASSDEDEGNLDLLEASFINDATQMSQNLDVTTEQAMYLRSVQDHPGGHIPARYRLQYGNNDMDVFSQMPDIDEEPSEYMEDSFCVNSDYTDSDSYDEVTPVKRKKMNNQSKKSEKPGKKNVKTVNGLKRVRHMVDTSSEEEGYGMMHNITDISARSTQRVAGTVMKSKRIISSSSSDTSPAVPSAKKQPQKQRLQHETAPQKQPHEQQLQHDISSHMYFESQTRKSENIGSLGNKYTSSALNLGHCGEKHTDFHLSTKIVNTGSIYSEGNRKTLGNADKISKEEGTGQECVADQKLEHTENPVEDCGMFNLQFDDLLDDDLETTSVSGENVVETSSVKKLMKSESSHVEACDSRIRDMELGRPRESLNICNSSERQCVDSRAADSRATEGSSETALLTREERIRRSRELQEKFRQKHKLNATGTGNESNQSSVSIIKESINTSVTQGHSETRKKLTVLIDSCEINGTQDLISALRLKHGMNTMIRQLSCCDYVLSRRMAVERKLLSDFSNGANKQKLLERMRHLCEMYDRPCLVVEQDSVKPGHAKPPKLMERTKYVNTLLACLSQMHIKVFFTTSQEDTAEILDSLAKKEDEKQMAITAPANVNPSQEAVLKFYLSLPKINYPAALNMLHSYRTVADLVNTSTATLERVACVSHTKAQEILRYLHHHYDENMASLLK